MIIPNELYKKNEKGKYEPVGYEFTGFPANGVWVVEDGRQNCVYPFKGTTEIPTPSLVSYMKCANELQEVISKVWKDKPLSVVDISQIACEFFAMKAGAIKVGGEIIEG